MTHPSPTVSDNSDETSYIGARQVPRTRRGAWRRAQVTGDWLAQGVAVSAYWYGLPLPDGAIVPHFTLSDGQALCQHMPGLTYHPQQDAFREDRSGRRPRWYHAVTVAIEGRDVTLYAIGGSYWRWQLALKAAACRNPDDL